MTMEAKVQGLGYNEEQRYGLITFEYSHLWIKDTAYVGTYWWERIVAERR